MAGKKKIIGSLEVSGSIVSVEEPLVVETKKILWADLVALRDAGELIPGQQYRITDYITTTTQADTQSAGHQFDIIVIADSADKLNENVRACLHEGDTYFANSKLEAWQLKYCLDNDINRFGWADGQGGKGVIYRMIDEFNNDVPYDFKNIQFKRISLHGAAYYFTFTWITEDKTKWDASIHPELTNDEGQGSRVFDNIIPLTKSRDGYNLYILNDNVFIAEHHVDGGIFYGWRGNIAEDYFVSNTFGDSCYANTFGEGCHSNTFGNGCNANTFGDGCHSNAFGNSCSSNTFDDDCRSNTFGVRCSFNTFGNGCYDNTFDDDCIYSTFGHYCFSNTIGDNCMSNTFGYGCSSNTIGGFSNHNTIGDNCGSNTFGNSCWNNTFDKDCWTNTFGEGCSYNSFDRQCSYNTFGNGCSFNTFGSSCSLNTFGDSCLYNTFGNDCWYLQISDNTGTQKKYIHVENGTQGASNTNLFDLYDPAILNNNYQVTFKKSASGKYLMLWATDTGTMTGKVKEDNTDNTWEDIV